MLSIFLNRSRDRLEIIITYPQLKEKYFWDYNNQGPDFDDMSSFFPYEIDDAIQYINLGYGAQAPKIVIL